MIYQVVLFLCCELRQLPFFRKVNTEAIAGEGMILTAGGVDTHIHFICPQLADEAIAAGTSLPFLFIVICAILEMFKTRQQYVPSELEADILLQYEFLSTFHFITSLMLLLATFFRSK